MTPWFWPRSLDAWFLFILPAPASAEFCLEKLLRLPYRPWRQLLFTLLLAPALGRGFIRYAKDPADPLFWAMVLCFGGACGAAWIRDLVHHAGRGTQGVE